MEKSNNKSIGNRGEERASSFLESMGFKILERNYRWKGGEIDIIVCKENLIVFVEVKTWPRGDYYSLEDAIGIHKQNRIIETAKIFLAEHRQYNDYYVRFDVLALDMPGQPEIYHIENAFSENI